MPTNLHMEIEIELFSTDAIRKKISRNQLHVRSVAIIKPIDKYAITILK